MLKAIGILLALFAFFGMVSALVFFATTIGWIIAVGMIILLLCAAVVSVVGQFFSSICGDDSDENKGP